MTDQRSNNHDALGLARIRHTIDRLPRAGKLLDVGCGDRLLTDLMSERGLVVTGIDMETGEDATLLEYGDSSFDYVTCFETLEHIGDVRKAADELKRVVKDKLFLSVPMNGSVYAPTHVQVFSAERLARLFPNSVIEVMGVYRANGNPLWYWLEWSKCQE